MRLCWSQDAVGLCDHQAVHRHLRNRGREPFPIRFKACVRRVLLGFQAILACFRGDREDLRALGEPELLALDVREPHEPGDRRL